MKNFKKIIAVTLAAVLLVVVSVTATVAYLTLKDINPQENVFSVGDIDVTLKEEVDVDGVGEATPRGDGTGADYINIMPGDKMKKMITVTNVGNNPAYVALTVNVNNIDKIAAALDDRYTGDDLQAMYDTVFAGWGLQYNAQGMNPTNVLPTDEKLLRVDAAKTDAAGTATYADDNWFADYADNMGNNEWEFTYYLYLAGGESFVPFEGLVAPAELDREQLAMFKGLEINAVANAIQADNTLSAKSAFAALFERLDSNTAEVASAAELEEALDNAVVGSKIILTADVAEAVTLSKLDGVTINANGHNAYFIVPAGAELTDVTITDLVGDGANRHVEIQADSTVENLTITNCQLADQNAAPYGAIYSANPRAEITVTECAFINCRYAIYGSTPAKQLTIKDCSFENISSWAVLLNGGDQVGAQLTVDNCTFTNANGGIVKYLGSSQPEGAFTVFTNNTLTNCKGHDGSDAKWFAIPGAAETVTVSGNTLDGAEWIPGTAQGLGK